MQIIGVGNRLMGDDAVGPVLADELSRDPELRGTHSFTDAGTDSFYLLDLLRDTEQEVIILDCGDFGGQPGDILYLDMRDKSIESRSRSLELHACSLQEIWAMACTLNPGLQGHLLAVQSAGIIPGQELSQEIVRNLNYIKETIKGNSQRHAEQKSPDH